MSFQISALAKAQFDHLFALRPAELALYRARRVLATKKPGFPCRVSLQDAEIGEETILVHHAHQPVETPFQASHAIYVRADATQAVPEVNEVPGMLRSRILSLRAFDSHGMMNLAGLAEGCQLEFGLENLLADPATAYVHIHFAKPGCYAARADRP